MKKFVVSADLIIPVMIELEAASEDDAEIAALEMRRSVLIQFANTDDSAIGINIDGISASA